MKNGVLFWVFGKKRPLSIEWVLLPKSVVFVFIKVNDILIIGISPFQIPIMRIFESILDNFNLNKKYQSMITTKRGDEFIGQVAVDHISYEKKFEEFLKKNSIDPDNFIGIEAYFPTWGENGDVDLKIIYELDGIIKAKNVEIELATFFKLFTEFRIGFAREPDFSKFIGNIDTRESD